MPTGSRNCTRPGCRLRPGWPATRPAFGTAELNSSFYRWPRPDTFRYWRKKLPAGFCLSVKAPRGLTHARKLYGPETWVQRIERGLA